MGVTIISRHAQPLVFGSDIEYGSYPGGAAAGVYDPFTAADGTLLNGRTPAMNGGIGAMPWAADANAEMRGNRMQCINPGGGADVRAFAYLPTLSCNTVTADVQTSAGGVCMVLAGRCTDTDNGFWVWFYINGDDLQLYRRQLGAWTQLDFVDGVIALGVTYTVKMEFIGATINVYLNNVLKLTAVDAFNLGATGSAVGGYYWDFGGGKYNTVDEFRVT